MTQPAFKVYGYRWIILLAYMLAVAFNQLLSDHLCADHQLCGRLLSRLRP